jgi:hypothetical protein
MPGISKSLFVFAVSAALLLAACSPSKEQVENAACDAINAKASSPSAPAELRGQVQCTRITLVESGQNRWDGTVVLMASNGEAEEVGISVISDGEDFTWELKE